MKTCKASVEQAKRSGQTCKASFEKLQVEASENGMTIGQLAVAGNVNVETIRYYQREKLLAMPKRKTGSIRRYGEEELNCLLFIKRAQAIGFSLTEITLLLKLAEGEHCAETQALAEKKLGVIKQKLADLRSIESVLEKLISACRKGKSGCGCPIIDNLVNGKNITP